MFHKVSHCSHEIVKMVSRDAMASKQSWSQPDGLCNLGQTAGARLPLANLNIDHLVERFVKEWSRFDHDIISSAVTQWRARLRARV